FGEIIGVGIHVIAGPWLARTSVAAAVMGDAAIAARREEEHLVFERIRGKRPAMAEDNRLPGAPILVIDLGAVFGCDCAHMGLDCWSWYQANLRTRPIKRISGSVCRLRKCTFAGGARAW